VNDISERTDKYTDIQANEPEQQENQPAMGIDQSLQRRRDAFLRTMRARTASAAPSASQDAFEAVGEDAFAYLDRIDGVRSAAKASAEEEEIIATDTGSFHVYIPTVDAGAYYDVAGIRGGLFDSVQQSARGTLPPPDMRTALKRRTEPKEQPDVPDAEEEAGESPAAKLLRERIRSERYISIEEDSLTDRMDKSQFPAFKAALGLSEEQSIISETDDVPEIMLTRQQIREAQAQAREEQAVPEELPELFDGIGRMYYGGEDFLDDVQTSEAQEDCDDEEEQEVKAEELFAMLDRFEQEHKERISMREAASRQTRKRAYDPYNMAMNSRSDAHTEDDSIAEIDTNHGYAIDTEHHAPPPPEQPVYGSPKRRRNRPHKPE